ncbi:MAG: proline dehydrogenase family protein [Armatimonadota bacterium]|nr:proline dehydrogenase family protein [Armatimonadota bacterium]
MRRVVERFVAGDRLDEAIPVAEHLAEQGYFVTLDLLGEHAAGPVDGDAAVLEYQEILHRIAKSKYAGGTQPERINISIKLTQLGLLEDEDKCVNRLIRLLETAKQYGNFVRVDMEESTCTDRTLAAVHRGFDACGNVGVAIQSMLFRSGNDIDGLNASGIRVRLVKGAYLESSEVARQDKADIDEAYSSMAGALLERGVYPAFGTHDEKMLQAIEMHAEEHARPVGEYEIQMLFGIRRPLQQSLKQEGLNVRIYVPYGTSWYPYFTRRLAERPANLFFFLRSLFGR